MKVIHLSVKSKAEAVKTKNEISNKIATIVNSEGLKVFIATKVKTALDEIARNEVASINDEALDGIGTEKNAYLNSMDVEIRDNYVRFFNSAVINRSDKKLKPSTSLRYPLQLSLSSIIEYGIGYTGSINSNSEVDNWEYDVRGHGYKGWYYVDNTGNVHWTNGLAGRYVFLKLKWWAEENIKDIILEYIVNNI